MGVRQSALQRLRKNSISAKDIASQAWCEKQMELYITTPMPQTMAMQKGTAFHDTKKVEVFVPLTVEASTYPDRFYKTAYENYTSLASLREKGFCRELKLYGSIHGFKISGQLDELRIDDGMVMVVEDKTINGPNVSEAKLKADTIQVSLYKKLLDDIKAGSYTFDNFANTHSLETMAMSKEFLAGLESIGVKRELQGMRAIYKKMFEQLLMVPEIGNMLELRYFDRNSRKLVSSIRLDYDKEKLDGWLRYAMKYWSGEREAQPVEESEKWKCNVCRFFGKECKAWYGK